MTAVPHNPEVEAALIGRMLERPNLIGEVVGTQLAAGHFYTAAHRLLYKAIVEADFAGEDTDAMVIGELNAKQLGKMWDCEDREAVQRVVALKGLPLSTPLEATANLVKRDADFRELLFLARDITERVEAEAQGPEEIAGLVGQRALEIATATAEARRELVSILDVGRTFYRDVREAQAAKEQGIEVGIHYGLRAIDAFTHGHRGGELLICGGEPGVGKSAVWWKGALNYAEHQMQRPADKRVGALIISLEMSPSPSAARFASMIGGLSGSRLREGSITSEELNGAIEQFRARSEVPLWLNYAPTLKAGQLRALITEAVRKHNVGLVVLDHFRMWDLDERLSNKNDEDEEKVRFLKEQIASTIGVALVCSCPHAKA